MHADTQRAADSKGHRIGNGVVDVDELHREFARLDDVARLAGNELGLGEQTMLLQL